MRPVLLSLSALTTLLSAPCAFASSLHDTNNIPASSPPCVQAARLLDQPIIHPNLDDSITQNIQGPSLIRVPDWVKGRLGKYYLYFASHQGQHIRMAYADNLKGPWKVYKGGVLPLERSFFPTHFDGVPPEMKGKDGYEAHIASPDVHIDEANKRFILYYHGQTALREQSTRVALSNDGLHFTANPEEVTGPYLRAFAHEGITYAMGMPGILYRSQNGITGFERGPTVFESSQRHTALLKRGNTLFVFWTRAGDAPERIYLSRIALNRPWEEWKASEPVEILRPALPWEGANAPVVPSRRGTAHGYHNQLRDPAIFQEDGKVYLLYAGAAESGIGLAELTINDASCSITSNEQ